MNTIETLDDNVFKHLVMTIGALPTAFVDSMSYYEMIAWLVNYIQKQVIPAVNNNAEAVEEIQKWIETLDLQDEVDTKLEEMADNGELATIIAQIVDLGCVFAYNTIAEMAVAENLADGSTARVLGKTDYADGDGDYYVVRPIQNTDVVDGYNIVSLTNTDNLIAERVESVLAKYYTITEIEVEHYVNEDEDGNTDYWITHVPHRDSNGNIIEIKHALSNDATTAAGLSLDDNALAASHRLNATYCSNATIVDTDDQSPYYNKPVGPLILNGTLISNNPIPDDRLLHLEVLGVKRDNTLVVYPRTVTPSELINDGIYNTFIAFDRLLENGERTGTETQTLNPWNLLGQNTETKELYFFACNGRDIKGQPGMLLDDCVNILKNKGCDFVYRLDAGGSECVVFNGKMLNEPIDNYGQEIRSTIDFMYFSNPLKNKTDVAEADIRASLGNTSSELDILSNKVLYLDEIQNSQLKFNFPNTRVSTGDGGLKFFYRKNGATSTIVDIDRDAKPKSFQIYDYENSKAVTEIDGVNGYLQVGDDVNPTIKLDSSTGEVQVGARTYGDVCKIITRKIGTFSPDDATTTSAYFVPYLGTASPSNRPYTVNYTLLTWGISATSCTQIAIPNDSTLGTTNKVKIRLRIGGTWTAWQDL